MTIAATPLVNFGEGAAAAGGSAASKKSNKAGTAASGAALGAGLLPKPKTNHPYIVGLILITIGVAGMIGSVTGQLPAMIAALFDPNVLVDKNDATPGTSIGSSIISYIFPASNLFPTANPANVVGQIGQQL